MRMKIKGTDSLEEEFNAEFMPRVNKAVTAGLNAVASDLTASLRQHIQTDVYEEYVPSNYIGSKNDSGIDDPKFIDFSINGQTLTFNYEIIPSPSEWRKPPQTEYNFADGDDIIKSIQSGGLTPIYGYISARPPRPFWTRFMNEMFSDGEVDNALVSGMNAYDSELRVTADRRVKLEAEDREQREELMQDPINAEKVQY